MSALRSRPEWQERGLAQTRIWLLSANCAVYDNRRALMPTKPDHYSLVRSSGKRERGVLTGDSICRCDSRTVNGNGSSWVRRNIKELEGNSAGEIQSLLSLRHEKTFTPPQWECLMGTSAHSSIS